METSPLHLVIRFSDTMFDVGDVVALHNEVVDQHGAVWFGKLGGTLSQSRIEWLNKQIEQKILTFLYLVKGNRRKSTPYKAEIQSLKCCIWKRKKHREVVLD
jgi:hypothetical protein